MNQTAQQAQSVSDAQCPSPEELKAVAEKELQWRMGAMQKRLAVMQDKAGSAARASIKHKNHWLRLVEESTLELMRITRASMENISTIEQMEHIQEVTNLRKRLEKALDAAKLPV